MTNAASNDQNLVKSMWPDQGLQKSPENTHLKNLMIIRAFELQVSETSLVYVVRHFSLASLKESGKVGEMSPELLDNYKYQSPPLRFE